MPSESSFEEFCHHRALLSWIGHTIPDLLCRNNEMVQATKQTFSKNPKRDFNAGVKLSKGNFGHGLSYCMLDEQTLHMRCYADASFASNNDPLSQVWFLEIIYNGFNQRHVLDYQSRKARKVVQCAFGAEVVAFIEAFDVAFQISTDLKGTHGKDFDLFRSMDSLQLFDALTKGRGTDEHGLMIEILATRQF